MFTDLKELGIPEGEVVKVECDGVTLWEKIKFTNQIPISTDVNGEIYNGVGYKENTYISSSGTDGTKNGIGSTGLIPVPVKAESVAVEGLMVIRIENAKLDSTANTRIAYYDSNKDFTSRIQYGNNFVNIFDLTDSGTNPTQTLDENGYIIKLDISELLSFMVRRGEDVAFFRLCGSGIGADTIITVNEEI